MLRPILAALALVAGTLSASAEDSDTVAAVTKACSALVTSGVINYVTVDAKGTASYALAHVAVTPLPELEDVHLCIYDRATGNAELSAPIKR